MSVSLKQILKWTFHHWETGAETFVSFMWLSDFRRSKTQVKKCHQILISFFFLLFDVSVWTLQPKTTHLLPSELQYLKGKNPPSEDVQNFKKGIVTLWYWCCDTWAWPRPLMFACSLNWSVMWLSGFCLCSTANRSRSRTGETQSHCKCQHPSKQNTLNVILTQAASCCWYFT